VLSWITGAVFVVALYIVLIWAPQEAIMGDVQRVFYFHVSVGWVGALAFLVTLIVGVIYLVRGEQRWDQVAVSSVEIGIVFTFMNIVTGSIWARPIWNTWWTWDPRLVTATIMELIYIAYMMLRQGIDDPDRRARFSAIYGIVGFISVIMTFASIRIFRTIHPIVVGSSDPTALGAFDMNAEMRMAFFFSLFTFTLVYFTLLWYRLLIQQRKEKIEERKLQTLSS
jgi:heme exporter protein C